MKLEPMKSLRSFAILAGTMLFASCQTTANAPAPESKTSSPKVSREDGKNGIAAAMLLDDEVVILYYKSIAKESDLMNVANKMCGEELGAKAGSMRSEALTHEYPANAGFDSKVFVKCI